MTELSRDIEDKPGEIVGVFNNLTQRLAAESTDDMLLAGDDPKAAPTRLLGICVCYAGMARRIHNLGYDFALVERKQSDEGNGAK